MLDLKHKKLDVYMLSKQLVKSIYKLTENFPKTEMFGLSSQLRRASVSTLSNLSEGCSKKSSIERKRYFEMSRSSLVEIDAQIEISLELNYFKNSDILDLDKITNELFAKLTYLINNS